MNPETTTTQPVPETPVPSPQPIQPQTPTTPTPPVNNGPVKKKSNNIGRSVIVVGIFYIAITLLGALAIDKVASSEQGGYIIGIAIGAMLGIVWTVLGFLIIRNNENIPSVLRLTVTTLIFSAAVLVYSLARTAMTSQLSLGMIIVFVFTLYLAVAYFGLRKAQSS